MNKCIILTTVILAFVLTSFSQDYKGKVFLGGTLGWDITNSERNYSDGSYTNKQKSFNLEVPVGYFFSNKIVAGLMPFFSTYFYQSEHSNPDYLNESKERLFGIGPFIRGYGRISDKVDFFLQFEALGAFGKRQTTYYQSNTSYEETEGKTKQLSLGLEPGISLKLSKCMFLDLRVGQLSYSIYKYTPDVLSQDDPEMKNSNFGFSINYIRLGISMKIGNQGSN
jgi:hypothetical protein